MFTEQLWQEPMQQVSDDDEDCQSLMPGDSKVKWVGCCICQVKVCGTTLQVRWSDKLKRQLPDWKVLHHDRSIPLQTVP